MREGKSIEFYLNLSAAVENASKKEREMKPLSQGDTKDEPKIKGDTLSIRSH